MNSYELARELEKKGKDFHSNFKKKAKKILGDDYAKKNELTVLSLQNQKIKAFRLDANSELAMRESYSSNKHRVYSEREHGSLCAIEQLLGITLERQYKVGKYRIDGYHKESNTAYEIDEIHHFIGGQLRNECRLRQRYIQEKLDCDFVRIKV